MVLIGGADLLPLLCKKKINLYLRAPHGDLFLRPLQADERRQPLLRAGEHFLSRGITVGLVARSTAGASRRVPLVGTGGDRLRVGDL